jgi:hypothetical protein
MTDAEDIRRIAQQSVTTAANEGNGVTYYLHGDPICSSGDGQERLGDRVENPGLPAGWRAQACPTAGMD